MQRSEPPPAAARLRRSTAVAAVILAGGAAAAGAAPHGAPTARAPAAGVVYGGVTAQDYPIVLETSRRGRLVARATIGIRLTCTSGRTVALPDGYLRLPVRKNRKFGTAFGPETITNPDGTTAELQGSIEGRFNSSRTKVSGTWTFKATERDAAGAVTDTCDSGTVTWRARQ